MNDLSKSDGPIQSGPPLFWEPSPEQCTQAELTRFITFLSTQGHLAADSDYQTLHAWSIEHPETFWAATAQFLDIHFSKPAEQILVRGKRFQDAKWFVGAELNFAENLIGNARESTTTAMAFWNEAGHQASLSYSELYAEVARLAFAFRKFGVTKGDVIAAIIPNTPHAVIGMLAATSIGAVWTSSSPEFSEQGVLDRFKQVAPKVLIAADGYYFKGAKCDCMPKLTAVTTELESLEQVIVVPYAEIATNAAFDTSSKPSILYAEFVSQVCGSNVPVLKFEQLPSDHPVYIMYSSGTTGAPKCMVHGAIGTLLEHKKELVLHTDLKPKDNIFYRTTTGWMMWNWHVSALAVGAKLTIYDGDLNSDVLFELTEEERVTVFGSAAGHVQYLKNAGKRPNQSYDLSSLRAFLSTGSTLWPDLFAYANEVIGEIQIASISGGTDIIGCFALGCPILPVHQGELQALSLGYAVDVFNSVGKPVRDEVGELVCTAPFPSMPTYFMNDPDGAKYFEAYFDVFKGVWCHGDSAIFYSCTNGTQIVGRSDDILNPGGERFGPAIITNIVDQLPGVVASTAVPVRRNGQERVALFVKTDDLLEVDDNFRQLVKSKMINPRYSPHFIIAAPDFPYTLSGKLSNKAIRSAINAEPIPNSSAIANLEVLQFYSELCTCGALDY